MTGPQRHPRRPLSPETRTGRILLGLSSDPAQAEEAGTIALWVGHYPGLARRLQRLTEEGRIVRTKRDGVSVYYRASASLSSE